MDFYVDGYVVPVPKSNVEAYRSIAQQCAEIWISHGALEYHETVADDTPMGEQTSFPRAVQQKEDETCIFAWIIFRSRAERDAINEKVMQDPLMANMGPDNMPFDGKRLIWGGFKPIVTLKHEA